MFPYFILCIAIFSRRPSKVVCVFLRVFIPMLPHAVYRRNDHREYALHFIIVLEMNSSTREGLISENIAV